MHTSSRQRELVAGALGLAGTAVLASLLRLVTGVSPTTVALGFLLVVLATATLGTLWAAMSVAIVATVALNYFFLPPVGTLTIADPQNWVALASFLTVAVIASRLSAAAHARAQEAVDRRDEVTRLFDLTRDVLLTTETAGAIEVLARHVARRFDLSRIAVCLPAGNGWRIVQGGDADLAVSTQALDEAFAKARGTLEFDARQRAYGGHSRVGDGDAAVVLVPLRHGTKPVGLLATVAPKLDLGAMDALGGVVAIAIERAQFLGDRDAAELVRQRADLASTLLAALSHDLKTPLTAIRTAIENLRDDRGADERRAQADAAVAELERLTRLFNDILDMARIDASAITLDRQWVTPADVVDAALAQVRHTLVNRKVNVEADDTRQVQIDPRIASVALAHLVENAAHYSPAGQPIDVAALADAAGLEVSVTDHGPGLDPGELDHLFERFFRGRAARLTTTGTGMGLAITRGLLAAAGGRVWAGNVAGGARFSIAVPGPIRQAGAAGQDLSDDGSTHPGR